MEVNQLYTFLNPVFGEVLGKTDILSEDLSNIVDIGREIIDLEAHDAYVKKLINHIGKVKFDTKEYKGQAPSVLMDGWKFGSIMEKIHIEMPDATVNESWMLENGKSYDQDIFVAPKVSTKFFNSKQTFEYDMSFTRRQVEQSFSSVTQLNAFVSGIETSIRNRKTIDYDNLIMRTINNFTAATIYTDYPTPSGEGVGYSDYSGVKAVNLLYLYNQEFGTTLTKNKALHTPEFLRFAARYISLASDRLVKVSEIFNIGHLNKFTSKDKQHVILHSEFMKSADVYLQSDVWHNEYTKLPKSDSVVYWQGSGTEYKFDSTSKINCTIKNPNNLQTTINVTLDGILGVIFDDEALGVCNVSDRVLSHNNKKAEFVNQFYKSEAQYFNDYNENFMVFFIA